MLRASPLRGARRPVSPVNTIRNDNNQTVLDLGGQDLVHFVHLGRQ